MWACMLSNPEDIPKVSRDELKCTCMIVVCVWWLWYHIIGFKCCSGLYEMKYAWTCTYACL